MVIAASEHTRTQRYVRRVSSNQHHSQDDVRTSVRFSGEVAFISVMSSSRSS